MLSVYLSNGKIDFVEGEFLEGTIRIKRMCTVESGQCVIDGVIADRESLLETLKNAWDTYHFPQKEVVLTLGSDHITSRILELPQMHPNATREYVAREFAGVERISNPVYAYYEMGRKGKLLRLFAAAASREYLQKYVEVFKEIGVELEEIQSSKSIYSRMIDFEPDFRDKTCVVQFVDRRTLINLLVVGGEYESFSEKRLFSEPGTPSYTVEIARAANEMFQFADTLEEEIVITNVYVLGISEEDFPLYEEGISRTKEEVEVSLLDGRNILPEDAADKARVGHHTIAIGGLIRVPKPVRLVEQLKYTAQEANQRRQVRKVLMAVVPAFAALLAICLVMLVTMLGRRAYLGRLREYTQAEETLRISGEYDEMAAQVGAAQNITKSIAAFEAVLAQYPQVDSRFLQELLDASKDLARVEITGYNSQNGTLNMTCYVKRAEDANAFVERLQEQGYLTRVTYSGYTMNEASREWHVKLGCVVAENGAREVEE